MLGVTGTNSVNSRGWVTDAIRRRGRSLHWAANPVDAGLGKPGIRYLMLQHGWPGARLAIIAIVKRQLDPACKPA